MESTAALQEGLERHFRADNLNVYVYESRPMMGKAAASVIAAEIRRAIAERGKAVVILASAPSQNEFLANLAAAPDIEWSRVIAFHLDEYLGMDDHAPQSFRRFLIDRLVNKVPISEFHGCEVMLQTEKQKRYVMPNSLRTIRRILPFWESEKMVTWHLLIHHIATLTIPKPSRLFNSMRFVGINK
jgi:hypothetical protein